MKTLLPLSLFFSLIISITVDAQVDKTKLSTDVSQKYQTNYALLTQYTWKRNVEATIDGKPVMSTLSSVTIGPEGRPVAQVIEKESEVAKKSGIRGTMTEKGQEELMKYVKNAIELCEKYVFMTQEQMVDLFNKGTVSELYNLYKAEAFNFLVQGDHLTFSFDQISLRYMSQSFSTVMNGDPVKAEVKYEVIDGVNAVKSITLNLPARNLNVVATNSQYAKKL